MIKDISGIPVQLIYVPEKRLNAVTKLLHGNGWPYPILATPVPIRGTHNGNHFNAYVVTRNSVKPAFISKRGEFELVD